VTAYSSSRSDSALEIPFRPAMFGGHVFRFVYLYSMSESSIQDAVRDISACIEAKAYSPTIGRQFPLQKIAEAHLAQESGNVTGKILLTVGS
jgi:NADPH:quinone reductase-like Zn-dependent oxidoreductase